MTPFDRTQPVEPCEVEKLFAHFAQDAVDRFNSDPAALTPELTAVRLQDLPHTVVDAVMPVEASTVAQIHAASEPDAARAEYVRHVLQRPLREVAALVHVLPKEKALVVTVHTRNGAHEGACPVKGGKAVFHPMVLAEGGAA